MNPEVYSYLFKKLFDAGAKDVYVSNIIMKKNRPGNTLSVLCDEEKIKEIEKIVFEETTTFGIRKYKVERETLDRKVIEVETSYGKVKVKVGYLDGKILKCAPEYEECSRIAGMEKKSILQVYNDILREINSQVR